MAIHDNPAVNGELRSILSGDERDFLVRNNGDQMKVKDLSNKVVGLYFSASWCGPCRRFTPKLVECYKDLTSNGRDFEVVFVSADEDKESFGNYFSEMPWLAIPFSDSGTRDRLDELFTVNGIPHLVVLDGSGKVITTEGVQAVGDYGLEGYPFTPEKFEELAEKEKAKLEAQTLESLLVSEGRDYVIGKDGVKVPILELVGKNILLYFSAHWYPPCRAFLPQLVKTYHKIKEGDNAFEVIFISSEHDQESFDDCFATMPWLALPFGDPRRKSLSRMFKDLGIPSLVAIGRTGKIVTTEASELVMEHGANAYPFTRERVRELVEELEESAKGWPETMRHSKHEEHDLVLTRKGSYICDGCEESGSAFSFYCIECDFNLHPKCALVEEQKVGEEGKAGNEGLVCDGEVCYRA